MKFKKRKCLILHLGWVNPGRMCKFGDKGLESNPSERDMGVWVDGKLNMNQQCVQASKTTSRVLGFIKHSTASQSKEVTVPLDTGGTALVQPHLECCVKC